MVHLRLCVHPVNRKRVQHLMRSMSSAGKYQDPNTSWAHPLHKVYPYLLWGFRWCMSTRGGLAASPRSVWPAALPSWWPSSTVTPASLKLEHQQQGGSVLRGLAEEALREHCKPEVFNSDQGTQFTSEAFTGVLKREGVTISMDGRGCAFDYSFVECLGAASSTKTLTTTGMPPRLSC